MNLKLIENGIKPRVAFYDGICLDQYQHLAKDGIKMESKELNNLISEFLESED